MPKIKVPEGTSADVSQFDASGALEQGAKAGINLISPLVSIYRNKVEREAAVEAFRQSIRQFTETAPIVNSVKNAWNMAGDWLAVKKPRVAAHIRQAPELRPGPADASIDWTPLMWGQKPASLYLHEPGAIEISKAPSLAREYMAHEATHAAQVLGNREAPLLYGNIGDLVGYQQNPFEIMARRRGYAAKLGLNKLPRTAEGNNAMQILRRQLEDAAAVYRPAPPGAPRSGHMDAGREAVMSLQRMLSDRYGY